MSKSCPCRTVFRVQGGNLNIVLDCLSIFRILAYLMVVRVGGIVLCKLVEVTNVHESLLLLRCHLLSS
jgi:hypothetical protein